jgi:hypothetical protein
VRLFTPIWRRYWQVALHRLLALTSACHFALPRRLQAHQGFLREAEVSR